MKDISFGRKKKSTDNSGGRSKITAADICAVLCALVFAVALAFSAFGGSSSDKYISTGAEITFEPPQRTEAEGFWDVFARGAARFFSSFAPDEFFEDTAYSNDLEDMV